MKKIITLFLAILIIAFSKNTHAQNCILNGIKLEKTIGGTMDDFPGSISATKDGGYIFLGTTNSPDGDVKNRHINTYKISNSDHINATSDIWVVKLNSKFEIENQITLGGSKDERGKSISQTKDGGYILSGFASSNDGDLKNNPGDLVKWIVKLDAQLNIEWDKQFQTSAGIFDIYTYNTTIIQTKDGGYIFTDILDLFDQNFFINGRNFKIVKLDNIGNVMWSKDYSPKPYDPKSLYNAYNTPTSIIQTIDGGYAIAGITSIKPADDKTWVLKIDANGNQEWDKTLSLQTTYDEVTKTIVETKDRGYIICTDYKLTKLSNKGQIGKSPDVEWSFIPTSKDYHINQIIATDDGGCFAMGKTSPILHRTAWLSKISNSGTLEYERFYGAASSGEEVISITHDLNGDYVLAVSSYSSGDIANLLHIPIMDQSFHYKTYPNYLRSDNYDTWLVKLDGYNIAGHSYGGDLDEKVYSTIKTNDGGYIMAGYATSYDGAGMSKGDVSQNLGQKDMWVVKTDAQGKIEWEKSLGGADDEEARSIVQTQDGGYIIAGYSKSSQKEIMDGYSINNYGLSDIWVVKLDRNGAVEWAKNYGGSNDDIANSIVETANGYALAGYSSSNDRDIPNINRGGNAGTADMIVMSIDIKGNIQNLTLLGGSQAEEAYSIIKDKNDDLLVAGYATSNDGNVLNKNRGGNNNTQDTWIVKLDPKLNIIWDNTFGNDDNDYAKSIIQTQDGGYAVASNITSLVMPDPSGNITSSWSQRILKLRTDGKVEWTRIYPTTAPNWNKVNSIAQTQDGGYLLAGLSAQFDKASGNGDIEYCLTKIKGDYTNSSGQLIQGEKEWERHIGGNDYDEATSIIEDVNSSYTIAGFSASTKGNNGVNITDHHGAPSEKGYDYWLVNIGTCFPPQQKSNLNNGESQIVFSSKSILYPNPAIGGRFSIKLAEANTKAIVEVYNTLGSKVFEKQKLSANEQIDLSKQPKGIYLVKITANNKVITQKLVIE